MLKTVGNLSTKSGDQTIVDGNLVFATAGNGIDFSADPSAPGMTSELLDDYEEGAWSPVFVPGSGAFATMTMDVLTATYTKVGNVVTISMFVRTDNVDTTGASGTLRVSGIPFAAKSGVYNSLTVSDSRLWAANFPALARIDSGESVIRIAYRATVNAASTDIGVSDLTTGATANQNFLSLSGSYFVN